MFPLPGREAHKNALAGRARVVARLYNPLAVTPARILAEFEALASRLGIEVRVEAFEKDVSESRGGLCYVRGQPLLLIDHALPTADRIGVMAAALARFDLESIYVPPLVRARIDACVDWRSRGIPVAPAKGR